MAHISPSSIGTVESPCGEVDPNLEPGNVWFSPPGNAILQGVQVVGILEPKSYASLVPTLRWLQFHGFGITWFPSRKKQNLVKKGKLRWEPIKYLDTYKFLADLVYAMLRPSDLLV